MSAEEMRRLVMLVESASDADVGRAIAKLKEIISDSNMSSHQVVSEYTDSDPFDDEEEDDFANQSHTFNELLQDADFVVWLDNWCRDKIEDSYYNFSHLIRNDHMVCYRMITAPTTWKPDSSKHLGIYWSWDKNAADAHWGNFNDGDVKWLITAKIPVSSIEWDTTLAMNASDDFSEEKEIRIHENAPLEIINVQQVR